MEIKEIFEDEQSQLLVLETGYRKPFSTLTVVDVEELKRIVRDYYSLIRVKGEIDAVVYGLHSLDVLQSIKDYPEIMQSFFIHNEVEISKGALKPWQVVNTQCAKPNPLHYPSAISIII